MDLLPASFDRSPKPISCLRIGIGDAFVREPAVRPLASVVGVLGAVARPQIAPLVVGAVEIDVVDLLGTFSGHVNEGQSVRSLKLMVDANDVVTVLFAASDGASFVWASGVDPSEDPGSGIVVEKPFQFRLIDHVPTLAEFR